MFYENVDFYNITCCSISRIMSNQNTGNISKNAAISLLCKIDQDKRCVVPQKT